MIDAKTDFLYIPLVVVLWEHTNGRGRKRQFINNQPILDQGNASRRLSGANFNDVTNSVAVYRGPNYLDWKNQFENKGFEPYVALYQDSDYRSGSRSPLVFGPGFYTDLSKFGFDNMASSIEFLCLDQPPNYVPGALVTPDGPELGWMSDIPIVLNLHTASLARTQSGAEADNVITVVEPIHDIRSQYGEEFYHRVSRVEVLKGPNWNVTYSAMLHSDTTSETMNLRAPTDNDLTNTYNDILSSISIKSEKLIFTGSPVKPHF